MRSPQPTGRAPQPAGRAPQPTVRALSAAGPSGPPRPGALPAPARGQFEKSVVSKE